jgi:putative ABC transport system substrate-binding protein
MRRRQFITLLGAALAGPQSLHAQQQALSAIGFLHSRGPEDAAYLVAAFRRGLRDEGFIEGQNVRIEFRWARGDLDRLPAMARELVNLPASVIVAGGGAPSPVAAKAATSTIPIVFAMSGDPIKLGFASSYNRPGANVTGVDIFTTTLDPKRLSLLRDLVPAATTIGFLANASFPPSADQISGAETAARAIGVALRVFRVKDEREIQAAFEVMTTEGIRALAVASSPYFDTQRSQIVEFAARHRIPAIYHFREYALAGGLVSYGADIVEAYRQVGVYVSQILKGTRPGDIPILRASKFDLVINMKTARALGLTIPTGVVAIADEIIE